MPPLPGIGNPVPTTPPAGGGHGASTALPRGSGQSFSATLAQAVSQAPASGAPNYKAVDIDFQEALRIARSVASTSPRTLATTAAGHIAAPAQTSTPPYPLKYHTPSQPAVDGNTVEMDVERAQFAENAMMYEFSLDRVSGHFKHRMELLQGLKD